MVKPLLIALSAAASAKVVGACDLAKHPLATDANEIASETWSTMITDMGHEKTVTQQMAKAFLFIKRADGDVSSHKNNLKGYIAAFDDKLGKFLKGKAPYSKPPLAMICDGLEEIKEAWPNLRALVEPASDENFKFDGDEYFMGNLSHWTNHLMKKVEAVESMYV